MKRFYTAIALIFATLIGLFILIPIIFDKATTITEMILNGETSSDIATISALVSTHSSGADATLANLATTTIIIAWLIGIIDLYRIRKQLKK